MVTIVEEHENKVSHVGRDYENFDEISSEESESSLDSISKANSRQTLENHQWFDKIVKYIRNPSLVEQSKERNEHTKIENKSPVILRK